MRTKFSGILTLLLAFVVQLSFAQEKSISGTITDEGNLPLPGVNVVVKGTSNGTQTDFDGNYTINANVGQTLVFSYLSYKKAEQAVTAATSNISFAMEPDLEQLEAVVVTGFGGVPKEKRALGYALSSISSESIQDNPQTDLTRALQGKAAGININTQNGMSGSANQVIIRGLTSFSGSNNALYVVDGVPISNDANPLGNFVDGNTASNRTLDLDPNNIERVDILKGLAATTIWGTQGRNGVILITTKTGSTKNLNKKQEISVNSSVFVNEVGGLPDYQNKFGNGFDQAFGWFFSNWGPGFYRDGLGGWGNDPLIDDDGTVEHPYSSSAFLATNYPEFQQQFAGRRYDWRPYNSVEDFFRQGIATTFSINARGRSEDGKTGYGMVYSNLDEDGFVPGNTLRRNNLTISGDAKLGNKFTTRGSLSYARTNLKTPPINASFGSSTIGTGSSVFGDLFYTPRSVDLQGLPFQLPDGSSIYYRDDNAIQNPLWTVQNARFSQLTNRFNGFASLMYEFNDHFDLSYQSSFDYYSEYTVNRQNRGGVSDDVNTQRGFYHTVQSNNFIFDNRVVFNGKGFKITDKLNWDFSLGAQSTSTDFNQFGIRSTDQQVFGFFDHSGFVNYFQNEFKQRRNIVGTFATVNLDLDNYLFVNLAGRNDWVSNSIENTLFYPSASMSFIPTTAFEGVKSDNFLNYLKLRAGYGTSANFATGYPTATLVNLNTIAFQDAAGTNVTTNTTDLTAGNPGIKPELFEEIEFGVDGILFNNRFDFEFTYFLRNTNDLIVLGQPIPASTGATNIDTNIGKIEANGIEAQVGYKIFKNDNDGFNWRVSANYTRLRNEVVDLGQDTDQVVYAGFTNLGNFATVGQQLGTIYGSRVRRDENGNALIDNAGNYIGEELDENGLVPVIGDANPDFTMNYFSSMSYKGFSLDIQFQHVSGGDIYSTTVATLMGRGLTTDTEDRLGTFVLEGINLDTGLPNTVQLNNSEFYFNNGFAGQAEELSIYDASLLRLQEVALTYTVPSKLLAKTPFGSLSFKVSGFNLWYDAYNLPDGVNFDPNINGIGSGNGQGFDFLTGPSSRRYGFSVNASF